MSDEADWDSCVMAAWLWLATERLAQAQPQIDAVNVFPVADHDTGKNMLATMRAGLAAHREPPTAPGKESWTGADVAANLLRGVLGGARGNSGIILTQFWRAVAETSARRRLDAAGYAEALALSVVLIGQAVAQPVEGTAWSVLRAAAERARELVAEGRVALSEVVAPVVEAAALAVSRSPEQLPALAEAKVVDAGGLGVLCILDALAEAVEEEADEQARREEEGTAEEPDLEPIRPEVLAMLEKIGPADPVARPSAVAPSAEERSHSHESAQHHEVELELLGAGAEVEARLRAALARIGDSVVVAGGGERLKAHVHTADAGAAVLAGIDAGRVVAVRITNLPEPVSEPTRAVLALAAGEGLAALFRDAGAHVLDVGSGVSSERLAEAVVALGRDEVFVLPNGALDQPGLIRAASQVRAAGRAARFLPCGSAVQGLAAVAVHDPDQPAGDDEYTMASAAAGARWARLVVAREEAFTWAGKCSAGDCLGLIGDEVVLVAQERAHAVADLVDLMLASGGELVTVLVGKLGDESVADGMAEHMHKRHPGIELVVLDGGQPHEIAQVGVE